MISEQARENARERGRLYRLIPENLASIKLKALELKIIVLTHYGNGKCSCVKCGFTDIKALSIDHINGRVVVGHEPKRMSGATIYHWLKKNNFPEGYQTLCLNCQFIKRQDNHEFRNQYTKRTC